VTREWGDLDGAEVVFHKSIRTTVPHEFEGVEDGTCCSIFIFKSLALI
jgi:hypothetical protein